MFKDGLKSASEVVLGLAIVIGFFFAAGIILGLYVKGFYWVSDNVMPWAMTIGSWLFILNILCGFLFAFNILKPFIGSFYYFSSFLYGFILFFISFGAVYEYWGLSGIIITAIIIPGVGWVPAALLASIFNADWSGVSILVALIVTTYGVRLIGMKAMVEQPDSILINK